MARKSIEERLAQLDAQRQALKARLGKEGQKAHLNENVR